MGSGKSRSVICRPGFLLLEVLLAILLLSCFSVIIGSYWHVITTHYVHAQKKLQATFIATDCIDHLVRKKISQIPSTLNGFTIHVNKELLSFTSTIANQTPTQPMLVTVTISWLENSKKKDLQLYGICAQG